jgi:hypothetical protein
MNTVPLAVRLLMGLVLSSYCMELEWVPRPPL